MHLMTDVSVSIGAVMKPAGLEASEGVLSAGYLKDASDPQWKDDDGMKKFMAFIDKYMPGANISDANLVYGYAAAQTMVQVLKQAGDNLTRENVMKQAASLKDFAPDTLIPGITINTSATDFAPIEQLKMWRFKSGQWELFGDIISAEPAASFNRTLRHARDSGRKAAIFLIAIAHLLAHIDGHDGKAETAHIADTSQHGAGPCQGGDA